MINFRNFNLYRLLSQQVAPFVLGGEPGRRNAFLHFFEPSQIAPNPKAIRTVDQSVSANGAGKVRAVHLRLNHL